MDASIEMQLFAIRMTIERYQRILATYLTPAERSFIERRLKEESVALREIASSAEHTDSGV